MSKQFKHNLEDKLEAVRLYEKCGSEQRVSNLLGICPSLVHTWVQLYRLHGPSALIPRATSQTYSPEIRIAIVEDLRNKNVSLRSASALFNVPAHTLSRWCRAVEERGFTALFDKIPQNHIPGMPLKKRKTEPLTELEQLREENMRLRAELDLIKKVDALVAKRCEPTRKSVRKPSKD